MPDDIPLSVCREILLRLPAVSLFRLKAVCKGWRNLIDDPCFVKAHTQYQLKSNKSTTILFRNSTGPPFHPLYYLDLEGLNNTNNNAPQTFDASATPLNLTRTQLSRLPPLPVDSCNGLMLIVPEYLENTYRDNEVNWDPNGIWEIMNMITNERLKLPGPNIKSRVLCIGLGYDFVADDYKVVAIDWQTHVYSLKSDSWNIIGDCPFDFENQCRGVYLNGALHWVLSRERIIVRLDVATEKYSQLALPSFERKPVMQLDALSGCLFFSTFGRSKFDLWVINDYGEKEDSWVKLFSLDSCQNFRLVAYKKNRKGVLMQSNEGLVLKDFENKYVKAVDIHGVISSRVSAQTCVGSLFRLHRGPAPVVAAADKRRKILKMADTKLSVCVSADNIIGNNKPTHDHCYRFHSNWYINSLSQVCGSSDSFATTLSVIPLDIFREILLCLPAKSLIRFRAVCKSWLAVIDGQSFIKAHTNNQLTSHTLVIRHSTGPPFHPLYSFDLNDLKFTQEGVQSIPATPLGFTHSGLPRLPSFPVDVCNGLVLIAKETWEIWNLSTHEWLELPPGKFKYNPNEGAIGLGYDETTDDYKAVVILSQPYDRSKHQTHVYSLNSDSWRRIGNYPSDGDWHAGYWECPVGPGVFLCGALNWLFESQMSDKIIALDLGTEKYRFIKMPPLWKRGNCYERQNFLNVLDGCLSLSDFGESGDDIDIITHFDVWVMKDYGDEDSWMKLFSIGKLQLQMVDYLRPVAYMKDKMQAFLQDDRFRFYFLDVESNSIKRVFIHGITGNMYAQIIPGSIFRLHDNCGVSGKRRIMTSTTSEVKLFADTELMVCVRDANWHDDNPHDSCES